MSAGRTFSVRPCVRSRVGLVSLPFPRHTVKSDGAGWVADARPRRPGRCVPWPTTVAGWRMAQISLGEGRWRMIRGVLKKKRFRYDDARNQTRHDQTHFDWLVRNGFFEKAGNDGWFALTEKGKAASD